MDYSKTIKKADDASKELIIEALSGNVTFGFDVDSIYYFESEGKWVVIEFLKCDHSSVRPGTSHPKRYWSMNWRKFASLWRLVEALSAEFYLVNYEDQAHASAQNRSEREFRILKVLSLVPSEGGGITKEESKTVDLQAFKIWFQNLNNRGRSK